MREVFRFINSLMSWRQRIILIITVCSPLLLSGFLYFLSSTYGIGFLHTQTKLYLIVMWIFSVIIFSIFFIIFVFHVTRHRAYNANRSRIANSIINLLENRLRDRNEFIYFLCFIIICYYYLALIPYIVEFAKGDIYTTLYMTIGPLFLLLVLTNLTRNIFIGFREKTINRYFGITSFLFVWVIFYWLNLSSKIEISPITGSDVFLFLNENTHWIIPLIVSTFIVVIIYIAEGKLRRAYPKRIIHRWERSMSSFDLFSEVILSYIFLSILVILVLFIGIISLIGYTEIQNLMLLIILIFTAAILLMSFFFIQIFAKSFVENMISWNDFFNCYNGHPISRLGDDYRQLIKVKGKCKAISINEKYRKKFENFHQHLFIDMDGSDKDMDIISLEEKTPFKNYLQIACENDEIIFVGELKSILDDEAIFTDDNRTSQLIIAHHIELNNPISNDGNDIKKKKSKNKTKTSTRKTSTRNK